MKFSDRIGLINMKGLQFRIGELSKMTDVSARQLRYWEQKGLIEANERPHNRGPRVYHFSMYLKVQLIKHYLDEGYTLAKANEKSQSTLDSAKWLHNFVVAAFGETTEIDGKEAIDMGYFDAEHTQRLYGFNDENGVSYKVQDIE